MTDHAGVSPILAQEYGLSISDALALGYTGDFACDAAGDDPLNEETTDWPEAEIVQALLDKVDELEAQETNIV